MALAARVSARPAAGQMTAPRFSCGEFSACEKAKAIGQAEGCSYAETTGQAHRISPALWGSC
jgi:hypothetical protein